MAKSRSLPTQESTPEYLTKPKEQFQGELADRIARGEDLVNRSVNSKEELQQLNDDFGYWHDYNKELLSRAFTQTSNKYYEQYCWYPTSFMLTSSNKERRTPGFAEQVHSEKENIAKYITRLKKIKEKLPLIDELPDRVKEDKKIDQHKNALQHLENLLARFHKSVQSLRVRRAGRPPLVIQDEYDVQYLLQALLRLHFSDIRQEDYVPSYAGGNSRIDFVLKNEKIVVETKMTNDHLLDNELGKQLLIDIGRYKAHPDCQLLVVFVYDKGDYIVNKAGLIADLEKMSTPDLPVRVLIEPG